MKSKYYVSFGVVLLVLNGCQPQPELLELDNSEEIPVFDLSQSSEANPSPIEKSVESVTIEPDDPNPQDIPTFELPPSHR